jgi:hypothetical protein
MKHQIHRLLTDFQTQLRQQNQLPHLHRLDRERLYYYFLLHNLDLLFQHHQYMKRLILVLLIQTRLTLHLLPLFLCHRQKK